MAANVWVYKCNRDEQDFARAYGDWRDLFRYAKVRRWGGSWCTGNSVSKHILNELIQEDDLILAYQTNDRQIVGVCQLTKISGGWNDRHLWMKPLHRFDPPVAIHELKAQFAELQSISAFAPGFPQTIYSVSPRERRLLEKFCGINLVVGDSEPTLPPKSRHGGACFGDPETNRKVERAAVRFVAKWYRKAGWKVKSVEAERCGYDLQCRRDGRIEHVEVKGIAGIDACFNITASELTQAKTNSAFIICVVTAALSTSAKMLRLTGQELNTMFKFRPLQYHATPLESA